jgi:xylulose-5-phosphate/fructose-6-phosphate phosphoketolase
VATALLRNEFSDLKIRFINVVDLAIRNEIGRYSIAIEAIDWAPSLRVTGAHAKDNFKNEQIACRNYAYEYGTDKPEIVDWKWPF